MSSPVVNESRAAVVSTSGTVKEDCTLDENKPYLSLSPKNSQEFQKFESLRANKLTRLHRAVRMPGSARRILTPVTERTGRPTEREADAR